MKVSLSVVVLAKNEERRIVDCIRSVLGWADEIIVVDDESTDNTCQIAQELGVRVLIKKMDIEGKHRNWAYAQAKNDWVFSVDADERPEEELKKEIKEVIASTPHTYFSIPFKTYVGDYWIRWGGWYPGPKVKLFRKSKFRYEEVEVHPRIIVEGSCGRLKNDVSHYSYKNWEDFLDKTNKQTTLEAVKWYKLSLVNPKKAGYKMNIIHALWRTLDRFIRTFFVKKGYRDGFIGFMIAYFSSLYQMVSYAKYRELIKRT
ncbi:MAG: glycosyltransferase family 2 protein [Candidatus Omnitrophica bacterium]|nr:glycosyltransferase family 2 protein [Candidatus Omnitrophota bacterium]MBU0896821.1 glycosyltransferase family 2 protein [Candidatus Omnitrophota bacterium]MBU1134536.1 glycosyltransferase family 2 protein [Candidatus Omnitrophota bacterium]MBU1810051.1 glycosyltransferase family 2 protein [Candidatus Omnitrophota bacterium]